MRTELLEDLASAVALAPEWDDLVAQAAKPLSAAAWSLAWFRHVAPPDARLRVIAVRDGDRLVGVAPLFCRPGRVRTTRWAFLGAGTSLRGDIVAVPGREAEVAEAVARCLADDGSSPGILSFDGAPVDAARLVAARWPERPAFTARRYAVPAPFVDLTKRTFDEWWRGRSSKLRGKTGRSRRKLDSLGGVFRFSETPQELERDLDAFWRLHHQRWEGRGGSDVLTPSVQRMLLEAGPSMLAAGRFRVLCLDVEERTISVQIFLSAGRRLAYWLGGFDEHWSREQPAFTSLVVLLERTWTDFDRLDLGGGGQGYKYRLADGDEDLAWDVLVAPGMRSWKARVEVAPMLARHGLARRMPSGLKERVKRLVRR